MLEPGRRTEGDFLDLPSFHDDEEFEDEILQPSRPWWRSPKGIAAIAGVLIIALLVGSFAVIHSRPTPITYDYATLATGGLVTTVSATGPVQGALYDVNFSGSGTISEIDVTVGQQVKSGQVLAKLNASSLQAALNQAQIQADNASIAEQNAYIAEQIAITKCDNEGANAPFDCVQQAENQYTQAQNSYALALQAVQTAQSNLADDTLKAPHSGTVTAINGIVGGTPGVSSTTSTSSSSGSGSGSSGGSTFIQIANLSSLQVVADVNEADIGSVAVNQPVTFTVSAYSTRLFRGTIFNVSPIGQSSSNVVTFPVTINVDSTSGSATGTSSTTSAAPSDPLLPGMTASVTIITAQRSGVLLLPQTAVTFARTAATSTVGILTRTQELAAITQARQMLNNLLGTTSAAEQDKPTGTLVVERINGKWVATPVVLGLSNGTSYEVLAGLSAGDRVVIGETGGNITPVASSSGTGTGAGRGIFGGGGGRGGGG